MSKIQKKKNRRADTHCSKQNKTGTVVGWQATLYVTLIDYALKGTIIVSYRIPQKIIKLLQIVFDDSECAMLDKVEQSKQDDIMSGFLLLLVVVWIIKKTTQNKMAIYIKARDDIVFTSSSYRHMLMKTTEINTLSSRTGLDINKQKTNVEDRLYINNRMT